MLLASQRVHLEPLGVNQQIVPFLLYVQQLVVEPLILSVNSLLVPFRSGRVSKLKLEDYRNTISLHHYMLHQNTSYSIIQRITQKVDARVGMWVLPFNLVGD